MKNKFFVMVVCVVSVVAFVLGCLYMTQINEEEKQINKEWSQVLTVSSVGLNQDVVIAAVSGNEDFDIEMYDFSFVIDQMEQFSEECEFTNLGILMKCSGLKVPDVNDPHNCYEQFKQCSNTDKNRVLSQMFENTGAITTVKIATDYDYVPTGEKKSDGKDITKYQVVKEKKVDFYTYSLVIPLEIKLK
ncbi:MAG: hypothetical protein PUB19_01710 [Lachnospiraceae bacterium]|nr:hypothetical protein [Lachnospiraceae bacterium]